MWSLYPFWPGEFYSITAEPPVLAIAQASAKQYLNFPKGRAVQTFSAAVRAGVSGSVRDASDVTKRAPSAPARQWAAIEVIEGMQSFLNNSWGPNLLAYTSGGGIENFCAARFHATGDSKDELHPVPVKGLDGAVVALARGAGGGGGHG